MNTAETVTAAKIWRFPWQIFQRVLLTAPPLQLLLLRKLAADFRQAQSRILMLGQENIFQRVVTFLVDMMAVGQFFDGEQSLLSLPMNRFDIADYLGTSADTAGRVLTRLEQMGVIERRTPRQIHIVEASRLRALQHGPKRCQRRPNLDRPDVLAEDASARPQPAL